MALQKEERNFFEAVSASSQVKILRARITELETEEAELAEERDEAVSVKRLLYKPWWLVRRPLGMQWNKLWR